MRLGTVVTQDRGLRVVALRDGELVELGQSIPSLLAGGRDKISSAIAASTRSHRLESSRLRRNIDGKQALAHVGGYCVFNDVSIRDFQLAGTQWTPGKNFDGTGPLGPFIVTADEIDDPQALELTTTIIGADGNEEMLQRSATSLMVHGIADLIAFLSVFTTLEPGDVIATGTPSGVGMARTPQRWLVPGETVRCAVEKIGEIKNRVVSESSDSA